MAITGTVNCQCSHVFILSCIDLQYGERFSNTDAALTREMRQWKPGESFNIILRIEVEDIDQVMTYDIAWDAFSLRDLLYPKPVAGASTAASATPVFNGPAPNPPTPPHPVGAFTLCPHPVVTPPHLVGSVLRLVGASPAFTLGGSEVYASHHHAHTSKSLYSLSAKPPPDYPVPSHCIYPNNNVASTLKTKASSSSMQE
ncbi:hypothetical protein B0H10DRAFT_2202254 [Mycena sp. CBHHK59/15]|nr:hypothetical protein B0H10DRAFT_2202254 [Mycena sp. CBHHK59/15]